MTKKIAISEFKAHCLEILSKLNKSKSSITITKRNKPIAIVVPFKKKRKSLFGSLKGKAEINGNIIESVDIEWEASK